MADAIVNNPGLIQGGSDILAKNLKVYAGEVITAFERSAMAFNRHITRTIEAGKSAQFPVYGRNKAHYLKPGKNLDDLREQIPGNEKIILLDGLLTSDVMITDIEDAMAHDDVRGEYAKQSGEALSISMDASIFAEIAKMIVADTANITGTNGTGKGAIIQRTLAAGQEVNINEETGRALVAIFLEASSKMTKNRVPKSERYAYVDPDFQAALINSWVAINRDFGGIGTIANGEIKTLAGFEIIEVPHLTEGGADAANVLQGDGHVFPAAYTAKKPVLFAHRTAVGTLKLKDLAFEKARRAEYQADQLIAKMAVGHGGLRPESAFMGLVNPPV
jgi:hypothetical protein